MWSNVPKQVRRKRSNKQVGVGGLYKEYVYPQKLEERSANVLSLFPSHIQPCRSRKRREEKLDLRMVVASSLGEREIQVSFQFCKMKRVLKISCKTCEYT